MNPSKPISNSEREDHRDLLDRNHNLIRRIETYKYSKWRRIKFWAKARFKARYDGRQSLLYLDLTLIAVILALAVWAIVAHNS